MLGTLLNAGAVLLGAVLGSATRLNLAAPRQQQVRILLGVATTWFGLQLLWQGLTRTGTARAFFVQFLIVLVGMVGGHLIGKLCGLQRLMNRAGQAAQRQLERASARSGAPSDGWIAAAILFCAAPLGLVGALEDGVQRYVGPLAVKAVMDGLAALSFARMFGWTALLAAIPLAAFLSGITLLGASLAGWLEAQQLLGVFHATAGLFLTYIAMLIFEVKKVPVADYLPALVVAPALMKLWNWL